MKLFKIIIILSIMYGLSGIFSLLFDINYHTTLINTLTIFISLTLLNKVGDDGEISE